MLASTSVQTFKPERMVHTVYYSVSAIRHINLLDDFCWEFCSKNYFHSRRQTETLAEALRFLLLAYWLPKHSVFTLLIIASHEYCVTSFLFFYRISSVLLKNLLLLNPPVRHLAVSLPESPLSGRILLLGSLLETSRDFSSAAACA